MTTEVTTESPLARPPSGNGVLLRSGGVALVVVLALGVLGGVVDGGPGASGALLGGVVALVVFLSGSLVVNAVAGIAPSLSLVFALMTYVLQVLVLGLFFAALGGTDVAQRGLSAGWLAAAVITVTATWLVVQVVLSTRVRIPIYDLPAAAPAGRQVAAERPGQPEAGAR